MGRIGQSARIGLLFLFILATGAIAPIVGHGAPYAAFVMDARTGEVIHSRNADTPLHPASLTKMMTLYVAFQAIGRGEISLDTEVRVTAAAAAQGCSCLGLREGQQIRLRYLMRAAAVKSANDAATAIGIAISGSEAAFAERMNATARAMGMTNTHFRNMNGLTQEGHYSTARDMSVLGRHLIYDFPQYYNLFSRRTADAGIAQVTNTNTRFLDSYEGADGIKTGYTVAAGYNLTASAERDGVRIIATVFGGTSTVNRNARVAELLDMGFARAPANAAVRAPEMGAVPAPAEVPLAAAPADLPETAAPGAAARTIRVTGQVLTALRPAVRPGEGSAAAAPAAVDDAVNAALAEALGLVPEEEDLSALETGATPLPEAPANPAALAALALAAEPAAPEAPSEAPPDVEVAALAPEVASPPVPLDAVTAVEPVAAVTAPPPRPPEIIMTAEAIAPAEAEEELEVVTRISTSGGRHWGITVGRFPSHGAADRMLIQVAVAEAGVLDGGVRRIVQRSGGFDANIMGLTQDGADLACQRLQARGITCFVLGTD